MPKIVYGLVDADWPTIPFSIKPGEAKDLPENEEDAETILNSGHVTEIKPPPTTVVNEDESKQDQEKPLSKSEERRTASRRGETE